MKDTKFSMQPLFYLILQIIFILILCLVPQKFIIANSIILLLLGLTLLMHSSMLITNADWSKYNIYNFVIIIVTILFIPAYAAFRSEALIGIGVVLIVANIVAILLYVNHHVSTLQSILRVSEKISSSGKISIKDRKNIKKKKSLSPQKYSLNNQKSKKRRSILKKEPKREYKIIAIKGGSKFHSLDCKMVENKSKKRLKYYYSAHDAQKDGLKPCKLCKAVSYLHQF